MALNTFKCKYLTPLHFKGLRPKVKTIKSIYRVQYFCTANALKSEWVIAYKGVKIEANALSKRNTIVVHEDIKECYSSLFATNLLFSDAFAVITVEQ